MLPAFAGLLVVAGLQSYRLQQNKLHPCWVIGTALSTGKCIGPENLVT